MIKFLGYKDYPFYRKPVSQKELISSDLPSIKLLNIKALVLQ